MQKKYPYTLLLVAFILLLFGFKTPSYGQQTINWEVETSFNAASSKHQPFWFYSNRYGKVDPSSANGITSLSLDLPINTIGNSDVKYAIGTQFVGRISNNNAGYFSELFAHLKWKSLSLKAGRFKETTGSVYSPLSMGSLSFSGNAIPMPKIKIGIPEYIDFPWTEGWVELKGEIAHGWFEKNRAVSRPWLHEKYGYVKFGGDFPLNIYGGLVHSTTWAGTNQNLGGKLPDGLGDYFKVFFATGGAEDAPDGDDYYFLGDHRGYWDFGATYSTSSFDIKAYRHFILNDKDNLKFNSPQDGLYGIAFLPKSNNNYIQGVLYEFLYTKWQSGPEEVESGRGNAGGWDDYYNNFIYNTGWSYYGNVIGNPLFITYASKPLKGSSISYNSNRFIANNRIVAHHLGVEGQLTSKTDYRFLATWSRNYGTYRAKDRSQKAGIDYLFDPPLEQTSLLLETETTLNKRFTLNVSVATDFGELYENRIGFMLGLKWNGNVDL